MPSTETVGLYLSGESGFVLNARASGAEVRVLGSTPFRCSGPASASEKDKAFIATQELKKALSLANVRSKNISICVPGDASMTRYFELPILPKKEEKNAVKFEAQKYVPFDIKELYYGYESYPDIARKKMGVVFLAAKKQWVDGICAIVKEAGLKIAAVELMSQAIAKTYFFEVCKEVSATQILIAVNDDRTAELIISQGPAVLVTRHLTLTTGSDAANWDAPMLVSEIRLSFDYFVENFKAQTISKICLLMDKTEQTQRLENLLRSEFSLPVETNALLPSLRSELVSVAQRSAVYGLSLMKGKSVNLMSSEAIQASAPLMSWPDEKKYLQDVATKAILGMAALLLAIFMMINHVMSSKKADLARLASTYPASTSVSISDPLPQIRSKEAELMEKASFAVNFFDKRPYLTPVLSEIPRIIPTNVLLTQMRYEASPSDKGLTNSTLHLEGYVLTGEAVGKELSSVNKLVQQFSANKEFMSIFDSIKIVSTKRATYKGGPVTRFALDCTRVKK